ncbi:hypothetical protein LSTR_LSTR005432 [Laodelphax striatellus]|uniref:Brinker DNA-binding domain-containing protein n=1 Tax=Laodelphax striatellus TaxID=195883 RepID=A0A482WXA8_LAOST|nr:hypothetical protein LSTR_LSTR005432 [Laodelphax striatellus]
MCTQTQCVGTPSDDEQAVTMINRLDGATHALNHEWDAGRTSPTSTTVTPVTKKLPAKPKRAEGTKGIGSRRIFAPHFKLQVLDSYRRDSDCMGNQRATARKYGIHRRQIQKWLQMETQLRTTVEEKESLVSSSTSSPLNVDKDSPVKLEERIAIKPSKDNICASKVERLSPVVTTTTGATTCVVPNRCDLTSSAHAISSSDQICSSPVQETILNLSSTRLNGNDCASEMPHKPPVTTRRAEPPLSPGHERITLADEEDSDIEVDVDGTSSDEETDDTASSCCDQALDLTCSGLGKRRFFSTEFKLGVLDAFYNDSSCTGNQRATARKFGINRRQIQKWLQQESVLRGDCLDLTCKRRKLDDGEQLPHCSTAQLLQPQPLLHQLTTTATCCPVDVYYRSPPPPPAAAWSCFLPTAAAWPHYPPQQPLFLPAATDYKLFRHDSFLPHRQHTEIKVYGMYR